MLLYKETESFITENRLMYLGNIQFLANDRKTNRRDITV